MSELEYIEQTLKRLIDELKKQNRLDQDFKFLTKAEREKILKEKIDEFLNHC